VSTDRIVPGDYDGDGKDDLAVFRPTDMTWYIQQSLNGFRYQQWGLSGDLPFAGDYDGDRNHYGKSGKTAENRG
jgi:hypothetical protein